MKTLNPNRRMRDEIIFGDGTESKYDVKRFDKLDLKQLNELVENNFIDLADCQNDSPSAGQFLALMKKYPEVSAHGYVVSPNRPDCRVTLEGLSFCGVVSDDLSRSFSLLCDDADELVIESNELHAWWG